MKPLVLLLAATGLAAVAAPIPKDFKEKRPDYCPMALGDKREYAHPDTPEVVAQTREITAVEMKGGATHCTQAISTGQVTVMTVDKTGVYVASSGGAVYDPPYKAVGPDIKAGDTWECGGPNRMSRSVGKPEQVVTPAGTFTAYPISITYGNIQGITQVLWYADGVGMVRYDSGGTTSLVLKKFTPGKEAK